MTPFRHEPRVATADDAGVIARLLHDFNTEFDTSTPRAEVLSSRLRRLLSGDVCLAILAGAPAVALALATLRPNVWYDGPVVLLDERYVVPALRNQGIGSAVIERLASECRGRGVELIEINVDEGDVDTQRFYERHGFSGVEATTAERAFYYFKELPRS